MILAGDIGGTSTRLGWFTFEGSQPVQHQGARYSSREHAGLEAIVQRFLRDHPASLSGACFGIAGPVLQGRVQTPNLPWLVDAKALSEALEGRPVWLINDLEANAYGTFTLGPSDRRRLNPEAVADPEGNIAIISAGTGLGEAGILFDGRFLRPLACEGGHSGFAPENQLEAALWEFLQGKFGRISAERVLSGPGLKNVYDFLRATGRATESEAITCEIQQAAEPAALISQAALSGRSELCSQALDLFVAVYGAEAGNLALKLKATRGVFVGGGIAPRILPRLEHGAFLRAFSAKGRLKPLLEGIPVEIILNDQAALFGSALFAGLRTGEVIHPELRG